MDSDSRALSLRDATLYRWLVAMLNYLAMDRPDIRYAASVMECQPERCGHGHAQESGAISDQATDQLDALQMESAIRPLRGMH